MSSITSQTTALPPQWVDDVDAVHSELSEIVRLMDILQSLHASRVGSVFGKDLDDMEGRIEKLTQDVTGRCTLAWHCISLSTPVIGFNILLILFTTSVIQIDSAKRSAICNESGPRRNVLEVRRRQLVPMCNEVWQSDCKSSQRNFANRSESI